MAESETLEPQGTSQKSFYGKASDLRGLEWYGLRSYDTLMAWYNRDNPSKVYVYAGHARTATTNRHIASWLRLHLVQDAEIVRSAERPRELLDILKRNPGKYNVTFY